MVLVRHNWNRRYDRIGVGISDHVRSSRGPDQTFGSPTEKDNTTDPYKSEPEPPFVSRPRKTESNVATSSRAASASYRVDLLIDDVNDEKRIAQAVGLVVCGWRGVNEHGAHFESRSVPMLYDQYEVESLDASHRERLLILDEGGSVEWLLGGFGSCFMVSPDGYVLTNKHVIEDLHSTLNNSSTVGRIQEQHNCHRLQPTVWVILKGTAHQAEIIHLSDRFDLAILKIDVSESLCFKLAKAEQLPRLTSVLAYGFPAASRYGLNEAEDLLEFRNSFIRKEKIEFLFKPSDFEYIVTRGTVNVIQNRDRSGHYIQHNADISGGNSGGPLTDENGLVWGVNTFSITQASGGTASGIFYALMMQQLRSEIDRHTHRCKWE